MIGLQTAGAPTWRGTDAVGEPGSLADLLDRVGRLLLLAQPPARRAEVELASVVDPVLRALDVIRRQETGQPVSDDDARSAAAGLERLYGLLGGDGSAP